MHFVNRTHKAVSNWGWIFCLLLWVAAVGCSPTSITPDTFNPKGPGAARILELWWLMLALGGVTFLIVMGLLVWALFRKRPASQPDPQSQRHSTRLLLGGGIIFPAIVLTIVFGFTLSTLSNLNRAAGEENDLVIEVFGHQWWWQIHYPEQGFMTANEIHIPVGEPVQFRLIAADVIHSFWVPELHGKLDLVPGQTNTLWLQADEAGEYWGLCAEFCGIQHAKMLFVVVAQPPDEFENWLAAQQESAFRPTGETAEQGFVVFMDKGCNECHTIRGTPADGVLGPDLTHFAGRLTLGAGVFPNNREYLARWVLDPHALKEGNLMPATSLNEQELDTLLTYLEQLQ